MANDSIQVLLVEDAPELAALIQELLARPSGRGVATLAFRVVHVEQLGSALARLDRGDVAPAKRRPACLPSSPSRL